MEKKLTAMQETQVQSLGQKVTLEKEMAIHSSILAWIILWTEEPGRLQSMSPQRVGRVSFIYFHFFFIGKSGCLKGILTTKTVPSAQSAVNTDINVLLSMHILLDYNYWKM